jgi:adenine C2-methylase RlmN of 23S rRNA A2503 and tRNA A37
MPKTNLVEAVEVTTDDTKYLVKVSTKAGCNNGEL